MMNLQCGGMVCDGVRYILSGTVCRTHGTSAAPSGTTALLAWHTRTAHLRYIERDVRIAVKLGELIEVIRMYHFFALPNGCSMNSVQSWLVDCLHCG